MVLITLSAGGADYYVSPAGSGDGSFGNPWPLSQACTNATITGGDTVWLMPGTYTGTNTIILSGTDMAHPITYRAYSRYTAAIDGPISTGTQTNIALRDLEIYDSNKTNHTAPFSTVSMQPGGNAIINCLIHDCNIGIAPHGPDLIYGNVLWNCGTDDSLEHGMYLQNETTDPVKVVEQNFIGRSSGEGIQAYGSLGGMANMHFVNNAIWQSGKFDLLFGGGQAITGGQVIGNHTSNGGSGGLQLGYATANTDAIVISNVFCGKTAFFFKYNFTTLTVASNVFYTPYYYCIDASQIAAISGSVTWDFNSLFKTNFGSGRTSWCDLNGTDYTTKSDWVSASGVDGNSTFTTNSTPGDSTWVYPNAYEAKRASIVVWNWSGANNISVDVSSVLTPGDRYELRSALNYNAGAIRRAVYGGGTISLPMTKLTHAPYLYYTPAYPVTENISTNFGAFILSKAGNGMAATAIRVGAIIGK